MIKIIGNKIRLQRKSLDLTIEKMADELNVSEQTISKIEGGERIGISFVKYLLFLKNNGADLNNILSIDEKNNT